MKMILAALMTVLSLNAQAASNSCAPTVQAKPIGLNCQTDTHLYMILIDTWMTDPKSKCAFENRIEASVAEVDVFIKDGEQVDAIRLQGGQFEYQLMIGGNGAIFRSDRWNLNLNSCAVGIPGGGVSVGN